MGRLTFGLALPAHGFLFHHGYTGPVHLRIQHGNRFSHDDRQVQLHGSLDLDLLAGGDVFADGLRRTLYRFRGDIQIGQKLELLSSVIERGFLADHGFHAAHSRRTLRVLDIQFDVGGKLTVVAMRA
jgi:hypothetical protein